MSPRSKKPRNCSCPFQGEVSQVFKPAGIPLKELAQLFLHHDELEALHLCDGLGLTQEDAGERMGISRGTVQRLVASARHKTAQALIEGYALVIGEEPAEEETP